MCALPPALPYRTDGGGPPSTVPAWMRACWTITIRTLGRTVPEGQAVHHRTAVLILRRPPPAPLLTLPPAASDPPPRPTTIPGRMLRPRCRSQHPRNRTALGFSRSLAR